MPGPNENCQLTFLFFVCYDSFLQDFCFPPLNQNSIFQLDFDTPQIELLIMIVLAYILYKILQYFNLLPFLLLYLVNK